MSELGERLHLEAEVVWLEAPGKIVLRRESLTPLQSNDLLCKTLVTAISPGTEIAAYRGLPPLSPNILYPRLQGYCNVAEVVKVGDRVTEYVPGDRILSFTSHRSAFTINQKNVIYKLKEAADPNKTACTYLFHLGYNAILRSGVRPGSQVLVVGLGAIGLTTVALAAFSGAKVFTVSDQLKPAEISLKYGAEANFMRHQLPELLKALGPKLADVVVTTVNGWNDWNLALKTAGNLAKIAVLGFPGRGEPLSNFNPLDSQYFYKKQLSIESVGTSPEMPDNRGFCRFNERDNIEFLAEQIFNQKLDSSLIVSGEFHGSDIESAYRNLIARKNSPITYLLKWDRN